LTPRNAKSRRGSRLEAGRPRDESALSQSYITTIPVVSYRLVDQILRAEVTDLTATEKAVLVYMASYADDDGSGVFCGEALISKHTNFGVRTVDRATKGLREKGYLVESGWVRRKRIFSIDIRQIGASELDDSRQSGASTYANESNDLRHCDPLSSNGSRPLSDHNPPNPPRGERKRDREKRERRERDILATQGLIDRLAAKHAAEDAALDAQREAEDAARLAASA
jgi:hypothetical protein